MLERGAGSSSRLEEVSRGLPDTAQREACLFHSLSSIGKSFHGAAWRSNTERVLFETRVRCGGHDTSCSIAAPSAGLAGSASLLSRIAGQLVSGACT